MRKGQKDVSTIFQFRPEAFEIKGLNRIKWMREV
jgi:hypothetical protein